MQRFLRNERYRVMSWSLVNYIIFSLVANWNTFIAKDSNFQISVPAPMEVKKKTMDTGIGEITTHSYFLDDKQAISKNFLYVVNHFEYPAALVHSDSMALVQDLLEESRLSLLEENEATLTYKDVRFYKNFPGQFFRAENSESIIKAKLYIIQNHFYSIQVYMSKEQSLNEEATKFLDSFEYLNR